MKSPLPLFILLCGATAYAQPVNPPSGGGNCSTTASTTVLGCLKVDGTSIIINGAGVASAPTGGSGTVTSASCDSSGANWITCTVNTPTNTPAFVLTPTTGQTSHKVIGTCGSATTFAPCSLAAADIPALAYLTSFGSGSLSPLFTASVATSTTTPALSFSLSNFGADNIFGNFTGGSAAPGTQAIPACANDGSHALVYPSHVLTCETITVSGTGTVTSFSAGNLSPLFTSSVATSTTTPALTFALVSQTQNLFFASPNGSSGVGAFRSIVAADIPTLNQNTTGLAAGFTTYPTLCSGSQFSQGLSSGSNNCGTPSGGGSGDAASKHTVTFSTTPTFTCTSASAGTIDDFYLSTALSASITASTLATCTSGQTLDFVFTQAASGGPYTVAMPTGFDACAINPTASTVTTCAYAYDGTSGHLKAPPGYTCPGCAGALFLPGNTTNPTIPVNAFGIAGFNSASATAYAWQPSATAPVAGSMMLIGAVSGGYAPISYTLAPITIAATSHNFLTSFTASTGAFTQAQPAISDLTATFSSPLNLSTNTLSCATCGVTGNPLSQFAATTSAQLAGVLSDETGTAFAVFSNSPALTGAPTAPTQTAGDNTTDVATDAFVTTAVANAVAGINPAVAVQAATVSASDTSALTYNNGVGGIGATFTGTNNTAIVIDGFTFTTIGQRLLVKNDTQSPSGAFNGVYYVTQVQASITPPILTRALDYDQPSDMNNTGAIPVASGTQNGSTSWLLTSAVVTVGTTPLTFTIFTLSPSNTVTSTGATTSGDLASYTSGTNQINDSGVITANVITAASAATAGKKSCISNGATRTCAYIDFPQIFSIPAANCNNTTAGSGWSIGSGGTAGCRAGTNNLGGFITISDTSSTFAQFTIPIPADWDATNNPSIKLGFESDSDTTSGHTVIPQIKVSCPTAVNGTATDDATFSAAQSLATITFGASAVAHGFYTTGTSNQIGSTQMTGCLAAGMMIVQVGRATDTATGNINFYYANVSFPRLLTVQAN